MKCQDCGKDENELEDGEEIEDTICPFQKEIYDEEVEVTLCNNCKHERWMDT